MEWLEGIIIAVITGGFGIIAAIITVRATMKSQQRNAVAIVEGRKTEYEVKQGEQRLQWFNELQEERNQTQKNLRETETILNSVRAELENVRQVSRAMSASYRRYIHTLRGQIVGLGGKPEDWPEDVEQ